MTTRDQDPRVAGGVLKPTHGMETDQKQIQAGYGTGSAHRDTTPTGAGYGVLRAPAGGGSTLVSEDNRAHVQMRYGNSPGVLSGGAAGGGVDTGMAAGGAAAQAHADALARHRTGDIYGYSNRAGALRAANRASGFGVSRPIGRRKEALEVARQHGVLEMARMQGDREDKAAGLAEQRRQFNEEVRQGVLDRKHDAQKTRYTLSQSQAAAEEAEKRANAEWDRRHQADIEEWNRRMDAQKVFNEEERTKMFEQWRQQQIERENEEKRARENAIEDMDLASSRSAGFRQRNRAGQARGFIANNPGRQYPSIDEYAAWNNGDSDGYGLMLDEIDRQRRGARSRT